MSAHDLFYAEAPVSQPAASFQIQEDLLTAYDPTTWFNPLDWFPVDTPTIESPSAAPSDGLELADFDEPLFPDQASLGESVDDFDTSDFGDSFPDEGAQTCNGSCGSAKQIPYVEKSAPEFAADPAGSRFTVSPGAAIGYRGADGVFVPYQFSGHAPEPERPRPPSPYEGLPVKQTHSITGDCVCSGGKSKCGCAEISL